MATKTQEKKTDTKEPTVEELRAQLDAEKKRTSQLEADLEAKNRREEPAPAKTQNDEPTEEQWVALEREYDMTRDEIRKNWKLVQNVVAPLRLQNAQLVMERNAEKNVRAAKDKAAAEDPQFAKYAKYVDEYLEDVPAAVKADPNALAQAMDKAVRFGRGSVPAAAADDPRRGRKTVVADHEHEEDPADDPSDEFFGERKGEGQLGFVKMKVDKRVPDEMRRAHAASGDVLIDERKQWDSEVAQRPNGH